MKIVGSGLRVVFVLRIQTKCPLKVNEAGLAASVSTNLILIVSQDNGMEGLCRQISQVK
jgi:hypothetical protein